MQSIGITLLLCPFPACAALSLMLPTYIHSRNQDVKLHSYNSLIIALKKKLELLQ